MKKLTVKVTAKYDVPDDFEIVEYNGIESLKMDNNHYEFNVQCLIVDDEGGMTQDDDATYKLGEYMSSLGFRLKLV